jgi:hypothetical protein
MVRPGWSEGGARVKQRSSKGSKGSMKGGEGCTKLKTMQIYSNCLRSLPFFEFATPSLFPLPTAASHLSPRACSKANVRGGKDGGVKRDVKPARGK